MEEIYLTSGGAARRLGIAKRTLLRAMHRGAITPAFQTPGGFFRFRGADVEAYARQLAAWSGPDTRPPVPSGASGPVPGAAPPASGKQR